MNTLHTPTPPSSTLPTQPAVPLTLQWKRQPLPPLQAVQVLDFRAGDIALLEVEQGRVWVTCDGLLEDYFLEAGQRLSFAGPVRLRVSAEGHRPARLNWAQHRAVEMTRGRAAEIEYWPTFDPTLAEGSREARLAAYREVRDHLAKRIAERFPR